MVMVSRTISPRRSSPASESALLTMCETKGLGSDDDIGTWDQHRKQQPGPGQKEIQNLGQLGRVQRREARQRGTLVAIEGRRNAPYAPFSSTQLLLLVLGIFVKAIRGIGDNGVNRVVRLSTQPGETIVVVKFGQTKGETVFLLVDFRQVLLPRTGRKLSRAIRAARLADEEFRCVKSEVGPYGRWRRTPNLLLDFGHDRGHTQRPRRFG